MRDSKFSITNVLAIAGKELRTAFITPLAYILLAGFLLTSGFFFFTLVQIFNQRLPQAAMLDEPMNLHEWVLTPFYSTLLILLVFILPILSMRSFAEERQRGTMELLLSAPLSLTDLVWGKFLGAAGIVGVMLLVVGVFPISLALVGEIEPMPMLIGFIGVVLFAAAFLALGVAISALTSSQTVAAIISLVVMLLFYLLDTAALQLGGKFGDLLLRAAPANRATPLMNGVIEGIDLVYFASVVIFGLFVAKRALEAQRANA